jgi:hypothetical protein
MHHSNSVFHDSCPKVPGCQPRRSHRTPQPDPRPSQRRPDESGMSSRAPCAAREDSPPSHATSPARVGGTGSCTASGPWFAGPLFQTSHRGRVSTSRLAPCWAV